MLPPPPVARPALTVVSSLALAAAVALGAWVAQPLPLLVPGAVGVLAIAARRPALLVVAAALAASALGARAVEGLAPPPSGPASGTVTLLTDPESRWGAVEVIGRWEGRHVLVRGEGAAGEVLMVRAAGERVVVEGQLRDLAAAERWLRTRHVAARLELRSARPGPEAALPWRAANRLRALVAAGAEALPEDRRSLYLGLLFGDDRDQTPEMVDDFRGAGLSHLLAVSGQNVVFVTVLVGPLLRRIRPGPRLVALGAVLVLFALITRAEPSVLRAVAMAAATAVAVARGRPTPGVQILALSAAGLVLIDPLLVRSLGFQLSVLATLGILVLTPRLVAVLPGPPLVTTPLAISAGAQLAVSPLLIAAFGGVPVVALAANLAAEPLAAAVMVWGLPLGLVAGAVGEPIAGWIHRPTALALGLLAGVGRVAASLPLGEVGGIGLLVLAGAAGALVALRTSASDAARWTSRSARLAAVLALLAPAVALQRSDGSLPPTSGLRVWRSGSATVVQIDPGTGPRATLEGLRQAGVVRIDLLVVGPGSSAVEEERAARHRSRVGQRWWLGPTGPVEGQIAQAGALRVEVVGETVLVSGPGIESGDGR